MSADATQEEYEEVQAEIKKKEDEVSPPPPSLPPKKFLFIETLPTLFFVTYSNFYEKSEIFFPFLGYFFNDFNVFWMEKILKNNCTLVLKILECLRKLLGLSITDTRI